MGNKLIVFPLVWFGGLNRLIDPGILYRLWFHMLLFRETKNKTLNDFISNNIFCDDVWWVTPLELILKG